MKKVSVLLTGLLAVSLLFSGCGSKPSGGTTEGNASNVIKIGWFGPLTGPSATDGTHSRDAALIAVDEINAKGGIDGKKVELIAEDDQAKPEEALKAVQKMMNNDKVTAIISGSHSDPTKVAASKIQAAKTPMVVAYAVHPGITKGGDYINRIIYTADVQAKAIADYAVNELQKKNIAVLYAEIDYGKSIYKAFKEEAERFGAKVVVERSFKMGDKDFSSILTTVKATNPDAVYIVGYYNEASAIVKQAKEAGITAQLLGADGFDSPKFLELGKDNSEGAVFATSFYSTDQREIVQNFVKAWHGKYETDPNVLASQSYDAALVILDAVKKAGTDQEKLAKAINEVKDFEGTSGVISFNSNHEAIKPVIFMTVKNGKFQFIKSHIYQ